MKITFALPYNEGGGSLVVDTYARALKASGHEVLLVSPSVAPQRAWPLRWIDSLRATGPSGYELVGDTLEHRILRRPGRVRDEDLPDADVVIATWWETAEWVLALSHRKGRKVYFVQGHEIYPWLPAERCRATYRAPLHKIVISRWLQDLMASVYGDTHADLVPNGVDHSLFHAPPRTKQARPTVGLLHSNAAFKGFGAGLEALAIVRRAMPDLRVVSFGRQAPMGTLPEFVEFAQSPPRDTLREIFARCDAWITASESEGFNLPAMEAMACRAPVVSTRTGWPAEAITNGLNGALVDVGDVQALARETSAILALPEAQWQRMSENAFATVEDSSWARSAARFESALMTLAESRIRP